MVFFFAKKGAKREDYRLSRKIERRFYILLSFHDCLLRVFMSSIDLCTHFLRYAYLFKASGATYKYDKPSMN